MHIHQTAPEAVPIPLLLLRPAVSADLKIVLQRVHGPADVFQVHVLQAFRGGAGGEGQDGALRLRRQFGEQVPQLHRHDMEGLIVQIDGGKDVRPAERGAVLRDDHRHVPAVQGRAGAAVVMLIGQDVAPMHQTPRDLRALAARIQAAAHPQGQRVADRRLVAGVAGRSIHDPRQQDVFGAQGLQPRKQEGVVPRRPCRSVVAGVRQEHRHFGRHGGPDRVVGGQGLHLEAEVMPHVPEHPRQLLRAVPGQGGVGLVGHHEVRAHVGLVDPGLAVEDLHRQHPRDLPLHARRLGHDAL